MSLRLHELTVPHTDAARRIIQAQAECWGNTPHAELDGRAPWEVAQTRAGHEQVLALLRDERIPSLVCALIEASMKPLPPRGELLTCAFERSGGLLNAFIERPRPEDDPDLVGPCVSTDAERWAWNRAPNDLFSGLSPIEVLVGGGPQELALLWEMLDAVQKNIHAPPEGWPTRGAMIRAFLLWQRRWQITPLAAFGYRLPMSIIFEERATLVQERFGSDHGE